MSTLWQTDHTIVDHVRIRLPAGYSQAAQQRTEHLLRNAVLRPSRLPLSAILFLRKLQDPAPHTRWDCERVHPPREWEESATRELDRLAAQAARPALAPVPPSAQAVLFLDRAELLACLAADWLQGTLRANWWWFTLFKRGDPDLAVFREWAQAPEVLPTALERLVTQARATEFLRRLPEDVVRLLLERMLEAFAVPQAGMKPAKRNPGMPSEWTSTLTPVPDVDVRDVAPEGPGLRSEPGELSIAGMAQPGPLLTAPSPAGNTSPAEPWMHFVLEASVTGLSPQKRVFLAQALMLRHAPAKARTITFQQAMAEWQLWAENQPDVAPITGRAAIAQATWQPPDPATNKDARAIELQAENNPDKQLPLTTATEFLATQPREPDREEPLVLTTAKAVSSVPDVETSFAGVFFLLNVALSLGLYADFTAPRESGLELNIWDFISLLGSDLIGDEIREDSLLDWLAGMAGQSKSERPGAYFEPPSEWILPAEWLAPFPEQFEGKEVIRNGRLQVLHPAGFVLSDKNFAGEVQLEDSLARWQHCIFGYIRARIARGIGREDAASLLCRIPGRVACSSTRVDVFYSLESYPIEIRLAGLDRDPGWIPAAGHYVAYHFQ